MKALNEKEINSYFFKTLVFYLIGAAVLITAAFLGVNLYKTEKAEYVRFYNEFKNKSRNNGQSFNVLQDIDSDLQRFAIETDPGDFDNLKDDIGKGINDIPRDSSDRMRRLLRTNFQARKSLIINKRETERKNISLNDEIAKMKTELGDLKQELKDCRAGWGG